MAILGKEREGFLKVTEEGAKALQEMQGMISDLRGKVTGEALDLLDAIELRVLTKLDTLQAAAETLLAAGTDLVDDVGEIVEGLEDAPKWAQSLVKTGERTLWRYSNLAKNGMVVDLRDARVGDLRLEGVITITPKVAE